jgi:ABC-type phosphate transport system substrate-binding protein
MLKRVFIGLVINLVGLVLASGLDASASDASVPFKVIVNPKVVGRRLPRAVLAEIYLGTVERWGDGSLIAAVDLSITSPVRQAFSEQALGMPVEAVRFHWLRKLESGKRPPMSKSSDEDVIAFVASERGAVGYVSLAAHVPETVREITVQ